MLSFDEKLVNYAKLLLTAGLNVQEGQIVNIGMECCHRDFGIILVEQAYKMGAKFVNLDLNDPRTSKARILNAQSDDYFDYVPNYITTKYDELIDTIAANLRIIGPEQPEILTGLDPKRINKGRMATYKAIQNFYKEGIGKSKVHWTIGAAATPLWGKRIFPNLSPEKAEKALWEQIFKITRVDSPDFLDRWYAHDAKLQKRSKSLNELKIKELHFSGPGTDLTVGLSKKAKFKGGSDVSPRNVRFEPNLPTEENFTTPDYRKTNGTARATRPFLVNGTLVKDLNLVFKDGILVDFNASQGEEVFKEYISSDDGAKRLGEVALVGTDSPIFQSGLVFEEILYDENAACHIAVGSAYKFCIEGGDVLSKEELAEIGCNESSVHTDMMISSEQVDVIAKTYDGKEVKIITKGAWEDNFK